MADKAPREAVLPVRRAIAKALKSGPLTAKDLSKAVGIKEKEVLEHLPHIAMSVGRVGGFAVEPSRCLACGFVFKKRERLKTPGKCPLCKSEEITETRYLIRKGSEEMPE